MAKKFKESVSFQFSLRKFLLIIHIFQTGMSQFLKPGNQNSTIFPLRAARGLGLKSQVLLGLYYSWFHSPVSMVTVLSFGVHK